MVAIIGAKEMLQASSLGVKVGVGYDFLSQEYFLDSTLREGPDSLFILWSLKTNYLDDIKSQLDLTYAPYLDRRLELQSSYEQTPEFIRVRFISDLRPKLRNSKFDINSEIEWRNRYRGVSELGDSYLSGYLKAKMSTPLAGLTTAYFQIHGDGVNFQSPSEFSYNFYRIGAKAGVMKSYENFSYADTRLFITTRQVPDSLELNYLSFGAEGSVLGFYSGGEIDLYGRLERKDYKQAFDEDDHIRVELNARSKVDLGKKWFTRQEIDFDLTLFS
ncbi:MAG: hypothetical protein ACE5K8_06035, partial [Candidatus Zixiibacteriota bacterium]